MSLLPKLPKINGPGKLPTLGNLFHPNRKETPDLPKNEPDNYKDTVLKSLQNITIEQNFLNKSLIGYDAKMTEVMGMFHNYSALLDEAFANNQKLEDSLIEMSNNMTLIGSVLIKNEEFLLKNISKLTEQSEDTKPWSKIVENITSLHAQLKQDLEKNITTLNEQLKHDFEVRISAIDDRIAVMRNFTEITFQGFKETMETLETRIFSGPANMTVVFSNAGREMMCQKMNTRFKIDAQ